MTKIGYVRVSTIVQDADRQEIALSKLGIQKNSVRNGNSFYIKLCTNYIKNKNYKN